MIKYASILLTTFNRLSFLQRAIQSVLDQTFKDFELLILDDNSSDGTGTFVRTIKDSRLIYLKSNVLESERFTKCRYSVMINWGLDCSNGEYIFYLTDDCRYYTNKLETCISVLENKGGMVCYNKQRLISTDKRQELPDLRPFIDPFDKGRLFEKNYIDHNSFCHRRECVKKVGKWPEGNEYWLNADWHFMKKLAQVYDFIPIGKVLDEWTLHRECLGSRYVETEVQRKVKAAQWRARKLKSRTN